MKKEDICTHLDDACDKFMGAVVPPVFQNSLFANYDYSDNPDRYVYTRVSNPTTEIAEKKIAALEKGEAAKCFSSGMGAITAAIMHYIKAGSHVITLSSVYGPAKKFFSEYLARFDVEVTYVAGNNVNEIENAIKDNTDLVYLESPSTFLFVVQDLIEIAKICKKKNIPTVVDNSWSSPIYQNPLEFGIDMVVHSASKFLGGHSDIVGGVVVGRQEDIDQIAKNERELFGAVMSPHDSWLLLRGLRTLPIRMKQHQESTMKVIKYLEKHPSVKHVIYPGIESHPQHQLSKKLMSGYTSLFSIILDGEGDDIMSFGKRLNYFYRGPSWGGFESLISLVGAYAEGEYPTTNEIPKGLVRLHIGLEDPDTLIEDLEQGLAVLNK